MNDKLDCIVAGGGVIGLAVGRSMALAGRNVAVLEAERVTGSHTSSRNSEVIHAGIYYPENSLKARLCVAGREALYSYCDQKRIPHRKIGKLIAATRIEEEAQLEAVRQRALENGVDDLRWVSASRLADLEPTVSATAALLSPSTGIIDSHALMLALQADIEIAGSSVVTRARVSTVSRIPSGFRVAIGDDDIVDCQAFVNAAGLWAPEVARSIVGCEHLAPGSTYLARGHYYSYSGRSPFRHLVYPVPADGGLGIHATNDLSGSVRFGPDVEWISSPDYSFGTDRRAEFVDAIRRYFPAVDSAKLGPAYTGIRPKLSPPGSAPADFRIDGPDRHHVPGLVQLFGIESPGLTASLAIAEHVRRMLCD